MKELGIGVLSQAQKNAFFWHYINRYDSSVFAVLQAAHAAEILIKACIVAADPLRVFTNADRFIDENGAIPDIEALFDRGRTVPYSQLPELLHEVTGHQIADIDRYRAFGSIRNFIQHLAVPNIDDLGRLTGEFIYQVLDPFIGQVWNLYAVEYCDDDESEIYLLETLFRWGIAFRYPHHYEQHVQRARRQSHREERQQ